MAERMAACLVLMLVVHLVYCLAANSVELKVYYLVAHLGLLSVANLGGLKAVN